MSTEARLPVPSSFARTLSDGFAFGAQDKLAEVEKIDKEITVRQFEELLRSLKMELHISIAELVYLQNLLKVIESRQTLLERLLPDIGRSIKRGM